MSEHIEGTVSQGDILSDDQLDAVAGGVLVNDGGFDSNTGTGTTTTTTTAPVKTATPLVTRTTSTTTTTTYTDPAKTYYTSSTTALSGLRSTGG